MDIEELTEGLKTFFPPYLEGYRTRVNELYMEEHKNSDSFYFMNPVKLYILLHEKNTHLLFSENNEDQIVFIDCSHISSEEFSVLKNGPDKLKYRFIKELLDIDEYHVDIPFYNLGKWAGVAFTNDNRGTLVDRSNRWGTHLADSHEKDYRFNKAFRSAIIPSTELEDIDTNVIIQKVNNPTFEYEFGESVKAYNSGLYLAAASTGGIALENILRLLIQVKAEAKLPQNTYIKDSLAVLRRENILPNRLAASVDSLKAIRNSNAHTNSDPVKKTTLDHLYSVIEDLSYLF
ncbi:hypothetical protein I6G82_08585 [Lysinibacillus macroides]|uniref:DUF4145 domain-containing protein n=1 Tax=Lysinibacillus macroides TaxID=33935 RepID=A0A0N0UWI3_9BACI|nr:hypothetical protein [Lysinibacillus macroides]KOY81541.1 hypothetical protein ADM90_14110 [Lysinibacillus macroides]QPR69624.1 hypothetical protein I6G82_08585 [Lysinibacillus macroides]